jgi:branched-chain amino acid aminotransferase
MILNLKNPAPKVVIPASLPFGRTKTNYFCVCDYHDGKGWQEPEIKALENFELSPSSVVFHYGQQIFEGLKAYRGTSDEVFLFRPEENARRLIKSAQRLAMEPVPEEIFLECVRELVRVESQWIPDAPGALYIRPMLIPLDEGVSYRASRDYRFCVLVSPVESYFATNQAPPQSSDSSKTAWVSVVVEREMARAVVGGVGNVKCGGNYASALPWRVPVVQR